MATLTIDLRQRDHLWAKISLADGLCSRQGKGHAVRFFASQRCPCRGGFEEQQTTGEPTMKNVSKATRRSMNKSHMIGCRPIEMLESRTLLSAAITTTIPGLSALPNSAPGSLDLNSDFADTALGAGDTTVVIHTPNGNIPLELFDKVTPLTVTNFLKYVDNGEYNTTIVHRSAKNNDGSRFVIQGGGFTTAGNHIDTSP